MRTIIAGGRTYAFSSEDREYLSTLSITEVLCGGAHGADAHGRDFAIKNSIPVRMFKADWNAHGKAAGPIRNGEMAKNADQLVAFWDGKSRGTADMIQKAKTRGLKVLIVRTDKTKENPMLILDKETIQSAPAPVQAWLLRTLGLESPGVLPCGEHATCDASNTGSPAAEPENELEASPVRKKAPAKKKAKKATAKKVEAPAGPPQFEGCDTPDERKQVVKTHIVKWLQSDENTRDDLRGILEGFGVGHLNDLPDDQMASMLQKVSVA